MALLFNAARKQSSQLRNDLDAFASSSPQSSAALQGQITTTLAAFSRSIDDYDNSARNELNAEKQEKARVRIKDFRAELADYRTRFTALKRDKEEQTVAANRAELLGRRPHHAATPENPYANPPGAGRSSGSPYGSSGPGGSHPLYGSGGGSGRDTTGSFGGNQSYLNQTRESHALREQGFFAQGNAQLDEYLERGRAVLTDLGVQKDMLKGTQKRIYDVANTLGVSGDTIRMVERRAKEDKWIFGAGVIIFFLFCWLVLHYLR